jgi:UDP-N-acetylglucosamine 1-carboxyvinyltransferase
MYSIAEQMGIDFKIVDKHTITVNSYNKANYKPPHKFQTRIYPWFPTDLQSIFWALFTQCHGISKIYETIYEWRFWYLTELENLWASIELLNPHEALIIWPTALQWGYVSSTDLRWWWAMVLAGIMAMWTTNIMSEDIILRWYDDILHKLQKIWVDIKRIKD